MLKFSRNTVVKLNGWLIRCNVVVVICNLNVGALDEYLSNGTLNHYSANLYAHFPQSPG